MRLTSFSTVIGASILSFSHPRMSKPSHPVISDGATTRPEFEVDLGWQPETDAQDIGRLSLDRGKQLVKLAGNPLEHRNRALVNVQSPTRLGQDLRP